MPHRTFCVLMLLALSGATLGCIGRYPNAGHGDIIDAVFRRRHPDPVAHYDHDPMMRLARDVTMIEDDLRRDGTITVKTPDVWGDGNLLHYIQEYDHVMSKDLDGRFSETLSAFIARSDEMDLQSETSLSNALSSGGGSSPTSSSSSSQINLTEEGKLFDLLKSAVDAGTGAGDEKIGLEPTELVRERSVYLQVNQALRRRMVGDDQSRAAGYGLYMFRIPVSVLPGRETEHNHAAVVNIRARLEVDGTHLENTFPKLVIADLVDTLAPVLNHDWALDKSLKGQLEHFRSLLEDIKCDADATEQMKIAESITAVDDAITSLCEEAQEEVVVNAFTTALNKVNAKSIAAKDKKRKAELGEALKQFDQGLPGSPKWAPPSVPVQPSLAEIEKIYGREPLIALKQKADENFRYLPSSMKDGCKPKLQEVRAFLFEYLGQIHNALVETKAFCSAIEIASAAQAIERGEFNVAEGNIRCWKSNWIADGGSSVDCDFQKISPILAIQSGILDRNLKKIVKDLSIKGKVSPEFASLNENPQSGIVFFHLEEGSPAAAQTLELWRTIIREEFPLHVFSLEPQVEEQNTFDAFSRSRELQLALAYSVAKGAIGRSQKVALARRVALEMQDIGLNRTVVSFAHGDDTFGWYFYPRVQSPPAESTNIGALARMLWSTGPTEHYDKKHRNLEPGMRECEVLVAMPSFVTDVAFDITTNWEKLTKPGVTKRSYEEMISQGARIQQLKMCLGNVSNQQCYRPGDFERLVSRVDQLEQMLGMQTYRVNVPYEFEQSGVELFDTGKNHLRPVLTDYYGLDFLVPSPDGKTEAFFFLTGKNFHPTLTHVIVGGSESHTLTNNPAPPPAGGGGSDSPSKQASNPAPKSTDVQPVVFQDYFEAEHKAETIPTPEPQDAASADETSDGAKPAATKNTEPAKPASKTEASAADPAKAPAAEAPSKTQAPAPAADPGVIVPDVEVINRELIRVRLTRLNGDYSDLRKGFTVRVATPAGLSNPVTIGYQQPAPILQPMKPSDQPMKPSEPTKPGIVPSSPAPLPAK